MSTDITYKIFFVSIGTKERKTIFIHVHANKVKLIHTLTMAVKFRKSVNDIMCQSHAESSGNHSMGRSTCHKNNKKGHF